MQSNLKYYCEALTTCNIYIYIVHHARALGYQLGREIPQKIWKGPVAAGQSLSLYIYPSAVQPLFSTYRRSTSIMCTITPNTPTSGREQVSSQNSTKKAQKQPNTKNKCKQTRTHHHHHHHHQTHARQISHQPARQNAGEHLLYGHYVYVYDIPHHEYYSVRAANKRYQISTSYIPSACCLFLSRVVTFFQNLTIYYILTVSITILLIAFYPLPHVSVASTNTHHHIFACGLHTWYNSKRNLVLHLPSLHFIFLPFS